MGAGFKQFGQKFDSGMQGMFAPVAPGLDQDASSQLARQGLMNAGLGIMGGAMNDPTNMGGKYGNILQSRDYVQKQAMNLLEEQRRQKAMQMEADRFTYSQQRDTKMDTYRDADDERANANLDLSKSAAERDAERAKREAEKYAVEQENIELDRGVEDPRYPSAQNLPIGERGTYIAREEAARRDREAANARSENYNALNRGSGGMKEISIEEERGALADLLRENGWQPGADGMDYRSYTRNTPDGATVIGVPPAMMEKYRRQAKERLYSEQDRSRGGNKVATHFGKLGKPSPPAAAVDAIISGGGTEDDVIRWWTEKNGW